MVRNNVISTYVGAFALSLLLFFFHFQDVLHFLGYGNELNMNVRQREPDVHSCIRVAAGSEVS